MSAIHFSKIDLNLLVALHALLDEGSVTRAAQRMGVTQSAMSRSLARLRALLDDPLLIRTRHGMRPSPRADALRAPLRRLVVDAAALVERRAEFNPAHSDHTFTLASSDHAHLALLPGLLARLAREAPGVNLFVRPDSRRTAEQLEDGVLDLAIGPPGFLPWDHLQQQHLLRDDFTVVLRADHPDADRMDLDRYCALSHALTAPLGEPGGLVDPLLAALGRRRRVALTAPSFLAVGHLVAQSDLISTLPTRVARALARTLRLCLLAPPLTIPGFELRQHWHPHRQGDPAHAWFRRVVREVAAAAPDPDRTGPD
ncbi:MAG: LysR family transcriptional regulator [Myxococcales bacterium]|nr:LysR family transcriptional regulator [Myxococcales bacterium]